MSNKTEFKSGIKDAMPICLGYLAVSFAFGISATSKGFTVLSAVIMSLSNVTSAGQYASLDLIAKGVSFFELAIVEIVINIRYLLMSTALTQKISKNTSLLKKALVAFGVTDEIFALSILKKGELNPFYSYGLIVNSVFGWVFGTFLGAFAGNILPGSVVACLGLAIYAMFIAIIIPPAKDDRNVLIVVVCAMMLSLVFTFAPILKILSSGMRIIIITLVVSIVMAIVKPIEGEDYE